MPGKHGPILERFWNKVVKTVGCWNWSGARRNSYGHGGFEITKGTMVSPHRFSWELAKGPIPDGLQVLHKCDNPACVNPEHLFLGTHDDNMADRQAKGRTSHGEKQWNSKLTAEQVRAIRQLYADGARQVDLAEQFGTAQVNISDIVCRKSWRHI